MQTGQSPPGAANRIERSPDQSLQHLDGRERLSDDLGRLFRRALRKVHQRQAPERQRNPGRALAILHVRQFERAAAEIADDAVRVVNRAHDAKRRQPRFLLTAQELDSAPKRALRAIQKLRPIRCVAHCSRRQAPDVMDPHRVAKNAKALKRGQRLGYGVLLQEPGHRHASAETAQGFFIERRGRRA